MMKRRDFLQVAAVGGLAATVRAATPSNRPGPRLLLREALQYENIGDVGRVPGTLRLLYRNIPGVEITLWPWSLSAPERAMLRRAFPKLRIAEGEVDARGKASSPELAEAWAQADLFLSPAKSAKTYVEWAATGRPYGFFGSAFDPITDRAKRPRGDTLDALRAAVDALPEGEFQRKFGDRALYERAAFIYCRDSLSLRFLQRERLATPTLAFGPEGCFALDLRDETRAREWMRRHELKGEDFLCVVPRLRYTPYYRVKNLPRSASDYTIDALNDATTARDHAPLRELITLWVRQTGLRVVACPEMTYQIQTAKEQLVDPLPDDVRKRVIWRDEFWLPDEAAALYARARAVVSVECHSPIIALAAGTPMLHVRQPVDSAKAQMFRDIGAGDWLFEIEQTSSAELWETLRPLHENLPKARARVTEIMTRVAELQRAMAETVARAAVRA
jgi:hypothetical protein